MADLGITGAEVVDDGRGRPTVKLVHRSGTGEVAFDWQTESLGTRSWFALLGPMLLALDEGAVLLVDELDASLHPRFAAEAVRLFHDAYANPRGAQLVFTSHDPSVLTTPSGGRLLEPGQVWLTEKDKDGATELYPLTAASPGGTELTRPDYVVLAESFGVLRSVRPANPSTVSRSSGRAAHRLEQPDTIPSVCSFSGVGSLE